MIDMFSKSKHIETMVLLSKLKSIESIEVEIDLDEMDLTKSEIKATCDEINNICCINSDLRFRNYILYR